MPEFSLKAKIACAVALLMTVTLSLLAVFLLSHYETTLRETLGRQQFVLVSALAEEIDQKIGIAQHELSSFSKHLSPLLADPTGLQSFLAEHSEHEPIFDGGLFIFSRQGSLLSVAPAAAEPIGREFSFRPCIEATIASGKPEISAPFVSVRKPGHPLIVCAVPLFDTDNRLVAVLAGAIDLLNDNFLGRLTQVRLGEHGYYYLYASDRTIILHPDRGRIMQRDLPPGANRLFDAAIAGFEGTEETITSRGLHVFSSFKRLRTRDWILSGNLPVAEAFAPIEKARQTIFLALATAIATSLLAIWVLMGYITAPLLLFIDRLRRMIADEQERVPLRLHSRDEIGVLAGAFDTLLEEIQNRKQALKDNLLFHQALVSTLPIPVYYVDKENIYLGCNDAFAGLFGCRKEELVGRSSQGSGIFSPTDLRAADVELYGNRPLKIHEVRVTAVDAAPRDMMVFQAPFHDSHGSEAGWIGILIDITERKRMEEDLLRSRDFYLTILEDFPALIWRSGLDARCDYFNKTWLDFTGRPLAEELGDGWAAGVHPDDLRRCLDIYLEAFNARLPFAMEYRLRRSDGIYRWVLDIGRPFTDLSGRFAGYIGSVFDISERRQAEEQLKIFSRVMEQSASAVIITDTEERIQYVNPACSRLTGYQPEELAGQTPRLLQSGVTPASGYAQLRQTIAAGQVWQGEFLNRKKNGEFFWVAATISPILNEQGTLTHFVAIQEDITERKTVQGSENRRQILRDAATEALHLFMQSGNFGDVVERLVGECAELLHAAFGFLVETRAAPRLLALRGADLDPALRPLLAAQLPALVGWLRENEGAHSLLLESAAFPGLPAANLLLLPLQLSGDTLAVLGFGDKAGGFSDFDRRDLEAFAATAVLTLQSIRAEEAKMQATENLRVAQKFEAIGQLAGGVAHDFNNLLTVINGYSAMLIRDLAGQEERRHDAETILTAGQKAANLTRQLLAFSRRQVLQPTVLDLSMLIDNFRRILSRLLREDIEVTWSLADNLGLVKADPGQIEQILINLVVNARDAMPEGGQLVVATGDAQLDTNFVDYNPGVIAGRYTTISVRDTGIGMTREVRERIFDPFFTTKGQGEGTGLGLSTVYGIVQQSGGYITVISEPGAGSEFRIFLPVTGEEPPGGEKKPGRLPAGSETILLVEDEEAVLALTAKMLRQQGYTVLQTSRPAAALELVQGQKIDLLITDMIMPEMNGPELAALLRRAIPGLRVLFMSGYGEFHGQAAASDRQEIFLQKPFSPEELAGKIVEIMERR